MKTLLLTVSVAALLATQWGCASKERTYSSSRYSRPVEYYYYPADEVYYDPVQRVYYWPTRDGEWLSGPRLPAAIDIDRSDRVTVRIDGDRPYIRHVDTRRRYPGAVVDDHDRDHDHDRGRPERYKFLYYPRHAVYLDPVTHRYFWWEDGRWEDHERPPRGLSEDRERPIEVELDTPTPEDPPDVRSRSPG